MVSSSSGIGRRKYAIALLAASMLVPATAHAADERESVDDRLDRLEAMIVALQQQMAGQQAGAAQSEAVSQLSTAVAETRAQNEALAQQQAETEARVAQVEKDSTNGFRVGDTTIKIGGYAKMDAKSIRTSGGQLPGDSVGRDFLIPSLIPVGGSSSDWDTHFHARQSRFIISTATPVGDKSIGSHLELDFLVTAGGDQRVSNSYTPRMRQAFITYDGWTFGQAWSNFQNVAALPDSVDFVGTMPGTVFVRQPMIRYKSKSGFSVSVENPETAITTSTGGRILPADDKLPDITARYDGKGFTVAAIVRQLTASDAVLPNGSDSAFGYGLSISGKVPIGSGGDDFRFMGTVGEGLGRYLGANIVNDAAIDASGNLDPIATYSGFAAFRHVWSPKARSTIAGSYFKADNPVLLTSGAPTDEVWNILGNIIYSPVPKLDLGLEYMYAERTNEAGLDGNLQQVQVMAKYSF
ncbi:DcaP family trimeric outer membrane transporter [Altererythrobacter arenosus]|uniref:DcaP family trimeric outer membrane transporter n=1 Tax=Altererythrobacter arenosus TaxID=3032592 RepID=A0ABY8FVF4_9SPHN|nr:DcaP family trimeric outer membrane transporter [Altererythrobacter sp. CAU 1644]WFL78986.1 DcaP family trimeric outer membrane transporter [Altererythrobacter sp. CAU 1644]